LVGKITQDGVGGKKKRRKRKRVHILHKYNGTGHTPSSVQLGCREEYEQEEKNRRRFSNMRVNDKLEWVTHYFKVT